MSLTPREYTVMPKEVAKDWKKVDEKFLKQERLWYYKTVLSSSERKKASELMTAILSEDCGLREFLQPSAGIAKKGRIFGFNKKVLIFLLKYLERPSHAKWK